MNGGARSVQLFIEETPPRDVCKLSDFKINGGDVVYTATCGAKPPKIITTSYHGTVRGFGHDRGEDRSQSRRALQVIGAAVRIAWLAAAARACLFASPGNAAQP